MAVDNDTRGWIMTLLSGVACVFGALFICVDVVVRLFPGMKGWKIQDSDSFLGCSLSLSAGVMLFSALYRMLPSAKQSLEAGELSSKAAAWILVACLLGGCFGIQIFSKICHHFIPSHAIDCDHEHEDSNEQTDPEGHTNSPRSHGPNSTSETETTPLLSRYQGANGHTTPPAAVQEGVAADPKKPSLQSRMTETMTNFVAVSRSKCDMGGSCKGYTDPCGVDCFKNITSRGGVRANTSHVGNARRPGLSRLNLDEPTRSHSLPGAYAQPLTSPASQQDISSPYGSAFADDMETDGRGQSAIVQHDNTWIHDHSEDFSAEPKQRGQSHHHHVPKNAFLSLSLQTSTAIALHKLPEGFITYATNHANPKLGFSVFLALFIHNLTEGFALALPIYLASSSRLRALVISAVLGGLSQPLGAGVAAVWLRIAERDRGPNAEKGLSDAVYGGMFAVTAGIMASVALSLLQESFELSHNKNLCMMFAFLGMGILGVSSALTA